MFAALGDPTRRAILNMLSERDLSAGEIAAPFHISRPAVSKHLHMLRSVGLVSAHKAGREQIYRLHSEPLREVYDWLEHYKGFWPQKMSALGEYLKASEKG